MLTLCFDLSAAEPKNIFSNGMFESADGAFPAGWGDIQYRQKTVKALAVTKHAMLGGKDGIELPTIPEGNQPQAFVGFAQGIGLEELKAPRNAIVRIDMACQNVAHGNVVAYANGKDNKLIYWKTIGHVSGNTGLRTYEFIAEIPAGAKYLNVSFRNFGAGTLWLTNARLYWEEDAPKLSKAPAAAATLLLNPSMEGAARETLPKGWSRFFYPGKEAEGRIEIQNGACSLTHIGGAFGFGVESALLGNISPMRVYPIEARYKTLNGAKFQISAEFRDAAGGTLGEQLSPLFDSTVEAVAKWQAKAPKEAVAMSLRWLNADKGTVVFTAPSCMMGTQIQENAVERFPISLRVFPAEWTADWSSGKVNFYTFRTMEMPLSIELCGDRAKLKNPVIFLEYPDCLEVSCYSSYPTKQYYKDMPGEIISRKNGRITLKLADNPLWSILNKHYGAQRTVIANIRGPKASNGPHPMRVWAENDGKKGIVHELDIFLLDDPKKVELPKSFFIGRWSSMDSFPFKGEIFERMVEAQSRCGYRQASLPWGDNPHLLKYIAALRKRGWTIACNHVEDHQTWTYPDYVQPKALDPNGRPYSNHICPEQLVDNPHTHAGLRKILDGYLKHMKAGDLALLDYEPFETMEWCFCDYCRAKFAKRFQLKTVPTASEIRLKHREQWVTFRCENTREITRNYADGLRKRLPGLNVFQYDYVIDYSDPEAPMKKFSSVSMDPVMIDSLLEGHLQSYYHFFDLLGFRMMRVNHARFKASYVPMGAISGTAEGYLNKPEALSPLRTRLMVLAAAVNGCSSYWFFRGTADASYLLKFQKALNEIARLEKEPLWPRLAFDEAKPKLQFAFRPYGKITMPDGKTIDTPDWKDYAITVQATSGNQSLAAIFNYHDLNPLFVDVSSSAFSGAIVIENVLTGDILFKGDASQLQTSVLLRVQSQDALFLKIRPAKPTDKASSVSRKTLEDEYQKRCKENSTGAFEAMKADGFSIVPELVDGKPGMAISNENSSFSVSLVNGGIQGWKVNGKSLPGNWGRTHIWRPESLKSADYPWKLGARFISKHYASVELSVEMDDVIITKTLQLNKDGSANVLLDFKNNSQKTISMTPKFSQLLNSPEFFSKDGTPIALTFKETVVVSPEGRHDGFGDGLVRDIPAVNHGMYTKVNGARVNCSYSMPERTMLFYFWKSASTTECTWEHVWLPVDVKPGKSVMYSCKLSAQ